MYIEARLNPKLRWQKCWSSTLKSQQCSDVPKLKYYRETVYSLNQLVNTFTCRYFFQSFNIRRFFKQDLHLILFFSNNFTLIILELSWSSTCAYMHWFPFILMLIHIGESLQAIPLLTVMLLCLKLYLKAIPRYWYFYLNDSSSVIIFCEIANKHTILSNILFYLTVK